MKVVLLILISVTSLDTHARSKAIYGRDDRKEIVEIKNPKIRHLAKSVAVAISKSRFIPSYETDDRESIVRDLHNITLSESSLVCKNERFAKQQTASECTAFLIAPNLLATAGHCSTKDLCDSHKWVFDFQLKDSKNLSVGLVKPENTYSCKSVLVSHYDDSFEDWGVIELDRDVVGRAPLKLSYSYPKQFDEFFTIGSPSGLPLKYTEGVFRNNNLRFFKSNLDTFSGNSGSPVFDKETNEVIGILARGDFDYHSTGRCNRASLYKENGGHGEDSSHIYKINNFINILKIKKIFQ